MPIINGVTFTEINGSCNVTGGQLTPMVGTRILDCDWDDRVDAVTALLGKIVVIDGVRFTIFPPDTFPGWENLEASAIQLG